ncbi:hypothetical protein QFC22_006429 [Naganishia vaughanmartiniae]|uniref:Uncharacterized protein n=1 Tax=Naganishia vaughanmartiniae TaxID=1424756 RepID=A0ACC2WKA3_9TREE|nr:hypothetical protein QFC22_006429 [Naganishia vaughanmartiniae]
MQDDLPDVRSPVAVRQLQGRNVNKKSKNLSHIPTAAERAMVQDRHNKELEAEAAQSVVDVANKEAERRRKQEDMLQKQRDKVAKMVEQVRDTERKAQEKKNMLEEKRKVSAEQKRLADEQKRLAEEKKRQAERKRIEKEEKAWRRAQQTEAAARGKMQENEMAEIEKGRKHAEAERERIELLARDTTTSSNPPTRPAPRRRKNATSSMKGKDAPTPHAAAHAGPVLSPDTSVGSHLQETARAGGAAKNTMEKTNSVGSVEGSRNVGGRVLRDELVGLLMSE